MILNQTPTNVADSISPEARFNQARLAGVYRIHLEECCKAGLYSWPVANCDLVAGRTMEAIERGSMNFDGPAFKRTCKELGIKRTRKAIFAFWNGGQA